MSPIFAQAVAAAMEGHDAKSWNALTTYDRAALIYAAMRKMDAESGTGGLAEPAKEEAA